MRFGKNYYKDLLASPNCFYIAILNGLNKVKRTLLTHLVQMIARVLLIFWSLDSFLLPSRKPLSARVIRRKPIAPNVLNL